MWQKLTIGCRHGVPVDSVHIGVVETLLLLLVYMIEHILAFGCQIQFYLSKIFNRFQVIGSHVHLLHILTVQNEESFSFFIHFQRSPSGIYFVE